MKQEGTWNKYWIFSLTREKLLPMMMREVRGETKWVQDTTYEACMTCANLTEAQKQDILILDEEIEL